MTFIPKPHEIYKHFKGNLYQVMAVATHTETKEQLVIYQAMYDDFKIYARPLSMFISRVDKEKYPKITQEFRFELQGPDGARQQAEMGTENARPLSEKIETTQKIYPAEKIEATEKIKSAEQIEATEKIKPTEKIEVSPRTRAGNLEENLAQNSAASVEAPINEPWPTQYSDSAAEALEEPQLDPLVLEFLDADTYEERLNILAGLHHRITDDMITTMAIACDVEVPEGELEIRYEGLRNCLLTRDKYECSRLR